jgi:hypothetical protein
MADSVLPAATGEAGRTSGKAKNPVNTGWSRTHLHIDTHQRTSSARTLAEQRRAADCLQVRRASRQTGMVMMTKALLSVPVKLELPNKITLSREDYLTVQQLYRGWALLGFVVAGALLSNLILTIMVRTQPKAVILTLIAFLCIVGTQVVFWTFTYPANQETSNWTMLPAHWLQLREQWEYPHAVSAVLNVIALITLILAVLVRDE